MYNLYICKDCKNFESFYEHALYKEYYKQTFENNKLYVQLVEREYPSEIYGMTCQYCNREADEVLVEDINTIKKLFDANNDKEVDEIIKYIAEVE